MRKMIALVLTAVMLLSLAGCGEKKADFDAKGYVQAIMDAKFKSEYANYAKKVGITEEEAKAQMYAEFKQPLEENMTEFDSKYGITNEEMAQYLEMEAKLRGKVQYKVLDAVKDDEGNYTVKVEIMPVLVYENLNTVFNGDVIKAAQGGATTDRYMSIFLASFQKCLDEAAVGEKVTFTFHVTGEEMEDKIVYGVSTEEMLSIDLIATGQPTK